jgi:hypothetical protein
MSGKNTSHAGSYVFLFGNRYYGTGEVGFIGWEEDDPIPDEWLKRFPEGHWYFRKPRLTNSDLEIIRLVEMFPSSYEAYLAMKDWASSLGLSVTENDSGPRETYH